MGCELGRPETSDSSYRCSDNAQLPARNRKKVARKIKNKKMIADEKLGLFLIVVSLLGLMAVVVKTIKDYRKERKMWSARDL